MLVLKVYLGSPNKTPILVLGSPKLSLEAPQSLSSGPEKLSRGGPQEIVSGPSMTGLRGRGRSGACLKEPPRFGIGLHLSVGLGAQ